MKRALAFLMLHKRLFFSTLGFAAFLGLLPLLFLGGYEAVEFVDSVPFCTQACHTVHQAEATTFRESPHSEVSCASCHVGQGTSNIIAAKLRGIDQLIPAITGNYERPIPTPLEERRPSSETCEKCHSAEKFLRDKPLIRITYDKDESNTKLTSTLVLKLSGGKPEVASGIHWHATARVWYLPVDKDREEMAWAATEDAYGNLTEYIDPNRISEITPAKLDAGKRLMDCVDCHNRVTHLFRSPNELIDTALSDGSIDPTLPFIKREALNALDPQSSSIEQAYAKIAAVNSFYRDSYPRMYQAKKAAIDDAIGKLRSIADLTTFPGGPNWNTYPDQAKHDKPGSDMTFDWQALSTRDASPGCFRCHGNLVNADSLRAALSGIDGVSLDGQPTARPAGLDSHSPARNALDAKCESCHYTVKSPLTSPIAPQIPHPTEGLSNCLSCHNPQAVQPFKSTHPWTTNEACNTCHPMASKVVALSESPPPDGKEIPHPVNKLQECLACHSTKAPVPVSRDHAWATNETCTTCHKPASILRTLPAPAPTKAPQVPHSTDGLEDCIACHGPSGVRRFSTDHPWSTNETCSSCHSVTSTPAPFPVSTQKMGPPVTHPTSGLAACTSCHNQSGPGPFPANHAGRSDSMCAICHKIERTPPPPSPTPIPAPQIRHSTTGLPPCTTCHNSGGPGPFPTSHAGRVDGTCTLCHQPAPIGPVKPSGPTGLTASVAGPGRVNLAWSDNSSNENGFRIERATNGSFTSGLVTMTVASNIVAYSDTTASASTTYYYRVLAFNAAGDSPASNTASVTTPSGIDVPALYASYYCGTCHGTNRQGGSASPLTPTSLATKSVSQVSATIANGTAAMPAYSSLLSPAEIAAMADYLKTVPPPSATVAAPTGLTASTATAGQVGLTWTDNSNNETGFRVERSTSSSFTASFVTATVAANVRTYNDVSVTSGVTYYYRLVAYNASGDSPPSNTVSTTPTTTINAVALYASNCAMCHGANRQGGPAPALTTTALAGRSLNQVIGVTANGAGSMPGYSSILTPAEISALAQFLKTTPP